MPLTGVGIVKLMGRDSGFVAMQGATAADVVDLCMIPEIKIDMKDEAKRGLSVGPWKTINGYSHHIYTYICIYKVSARPTTAV